MAPQPPETPPFEPEESLRDALARARRHARNALGEALEALRALLDAASLATSGVPAHVHPLFSASARRIREWSSALAEEGGLQGDLGAVLADALSAEIARWEERARGDADARAVLRAFLGLRELLWEIGIRPSQHGGDGGARAASAEADAATERPRSGRRVERVRVQG